MSSNQLDPLLVSFSEFADAVSDPVIITTVSLDPPGPEIVYVNAAFERVTKYSRQEALGKSPRILQGPKSDRAVLDRLRKELEEQHRFFGEIVNYDKDGNELIFDWHITAIYDERGEPAFWASVQHDISRTAVTSPSRISALIVSENQLSASGIRSYLGKITARVRVYEAYSLSDARDMALDTGDCDIAIVDWSSPLETSTNEIAALVNAIEPAPLVVISSQEDAKSVAALFDAGVKGLVPRTVAGDTLVEIIRLVIAGGTYVPWPFLKNTQSFNATSETDPLIDAKIARLTRRQREVASLLARGLTNEEIRQKLGVTLTTVKIHVSRALKVLGVSNRVQAAIMLRGSSEFRTDD